jgi:hypothetical protein
MKSADYMIELVLSQLVFRGVDVIRVFVLKQAHAAGAYGAGITASVAALTAPELTFPVCKAAVLRHSLNRLNFREGLLQALSLPNTRRILFSQKDIYALHWGIPVPTAQAKGRVLRTRAFYADQVELSSLNAVLANHQHDGPIVAAFDH